MVCVGARREPITAVADAPSINTKAENKTAKTAVKIDATTKAEKPKRRRKADK